MISVKEIKLSSQFSVDFIYVQVILNDTSEMISDYRVDLFKSNNENDNFTILTRDMEELNYMDYSVNLRTLSTKYFYKAEITSRVTGQTAMSEVFMHEGKEPDNEAYYLSEIAKMHLDVSINNEKMILLNRKHSGQLCPYCYDDVRKRSQISNCKVCFGTKYKGGYYEPQTLKVCFLNPSGQVQDFSPYGVGDKKTPIGLWTSNFPLVQNDDILVDINNNRYVVTNWQPSYKNFYLIRQTVQVMMLPKSNLAYEISVDINLL